jgi:hypothetical protein
VGDVAARKNPSKRLRFEVFKRDGFSCQYCGQQPPTVVLVADHIDPVKLGGASVIENLITACESCNQGKADKPLTERAVRPDADLLYLETQQEIAELRRFRTAVEERDRELRAVMVVLQQQWCDASGLDWHPSDWILRRMLARYSPDILLEAVVDVAPKAAGSYLKDWVPYMWSVARNLSHAREEQSEAGDNL